MEVSTLSKMATQLEVKIDNAAISFAVVADTVYVGTLVPSTQYAWWYPKLFTNPDEWKRVSSKMLRIYRHCMLNERRSRVFTKSIKKNE